MDNDSKKLQKIIELLQFQIAIQLAEKGLPRAEIRKRLGIDMAAVVKMIKGIKNDN